MRLIFRILATIGFVQCMLFGIGTQHLVIPTSVPELVHGINPAIVNIAKNPLISASYGNWLADIKVSSFRYLRNAFGGTAGLNFRYFALSDLELRLDSPTKEPLADFQATALAVDGEYNRPTKFGIFSTSLRYISIQLFDESANGFALDLGLQRKINSNIDVGFSVLNIGKMSDLNSQSPELPLRIISGANYSFSINDINNSFLIVAEKSSIVDGVIFRIAEIAQWNAIQFMLGSQFSKNTSSLSSGIGLRLGAYQINYGIQFGTQGLGNPQLLDISVILP